MDPVIIAALICAAGCILHFIGTRPSVASPTLVELGRALMWPGAVVVTLLLAWRP